MKREGKKKVFDCIHTEFLFALEKEFIAVCIKDPVLPGELEEPGGRVAQREVRHNGGTMDSSRVRQGSRRREFLCR